jgi:hypothetical protein
MKEKFELYKLIGDATYPMWLWFYSSFKGEKDELPSYKTHWNFIQFKGEKDELPSYKTHWNFIQFSTRMLVKC